MKRVSDPNVSGKGKVIKLYELNDSTVTLLEVMTYDSRMDTDSRVPISNPECIFNGIIRNPYDLSDYFWIRQ